MDPILILIVIVAVAAVIVILSFIGGSKNGRKGKEKQKSRQIIIREATKKLSADPHNVSGLKDLSDLYYKEQRWDKALPLLETLLNVLQAHSASDAAGVAVRLGVCAVKLNRPADALRALTQAKQYVPNDFEVNYYLGQTLLQNKEYEKAIPVLKKAIAVNPEVSDTYMYAGMALYGNHNFKESILYLKRALDTHPENKELLFDMADALYETGNTDRALKLFTHLRADPEFGARSCLASGTIHSNANRNEKAVQDFEIGLRHTTAPVDLQTNIRYRLAQVYLKTNDISHGLSLLKEIQNVAPTYKDVPVLITRYQELNQNKNLQIYLVSGNSDFVALCRKVALSYFRHSRVRIIDIVVQTEYAELLTEIETDKWEDTVVFRFYRTTGSTGELFVRDFHGRLRDAKAGRGICFTAGTYTDEARKYADGRPLDLIEKHALVKILAKVDTVPLSAK